MIQDYGFRIYNPTIGRFLSVDPLTQSYPWYTPYQFAGNKPIAAIDLDGLEELAGTPAIQNMEAIDGVRLRLEVDFGLYDQNAAQNALHHKVVSKNIDFTQVDNNDLALAVGEAVVGTLIPPAGWALDAKDFYAAYSEGDGWGMFFSGVGFLPFGDLAKNGYKVIKSGTKITVEATENAKSLSKIALDEGTDIRKGKKIKICQGCFTGEVEVKTEDGYKPIKDIKVGDKVWAYNDTTKILELKPVTKTIKLDFDQLYKISFGNDYVNATYEHPFYTSKGWKDAEDLRIGDSLFVYGDKWVIIDKITYFEKPEIVYNFIVEDFHTYFVSRDDILVHNGDPCNTHLSGILKGGDSFWKQTEKSSEYIKELNKKYNPGGGELRSGGLSSALNSASYYTKIEDQGSAIFNSIITGHLFDNGVKRTASEFIQDFADVNNLTLKLTSEELKELTINLAKSTEKGGIRYNTEELSNIIFD